MSNQSVDYQCVLHDLKARRARSIERFDSAIEAVTQIISELQSVRTDTSNLPELVPSHNGSDPYRKMTIRDACVHFIRSRGTVQSTTDLVEGIRAGGIRSKSKSLYRTIYNILTTDSKDDGGQVIRVKGKGWDLRERQA